MDFTYADQHMVVAVLNKPPIQESTYLFFASYPNRIKLWARSHVLFAGGFKALPCSFPALPFLGALAGRLPSGDLVTFSPTPM